MSRLESRTGQGNLGVLLDPSKSTDGAQAPDTVETRGVIEQVSAVLLAEAATKSVAWDVPGRISVAMDAEGDIESSGELRQ